MPSESAHNTTVRILGMGQIGRRSWNGQGGRTEADPRHATQAPRHCGVIGGDCR